MIHWSNVLSNPMSNIQYNVQSQPAVSNTQWSVIYTGRNAAVSGYVLVKKNGQMYYESSW